MLGSSGEPGAGLAYQFSARDLHLVMGPGARGGKVRIKVAGGHGGHNGIKSIDAHCGKDYRRLRLGIGHPRTLNLAQQVADFVLHRPRREDQELIERAIEKTLLILPQIIKGEFAAATTKLHTD